jgi:hypothetical protein
MKSFCICIFSYNHIVPYKYILVNLLLIVGSMTYYQQWKFQVVYGLCLWYELWNSYSYRSCKCHVSSSSSATKTFRNVQKLCDSPNISLYTIMHHLHHNSLFWLDCKKYLQNHHSSSFPKFNSILAFAKCATRLAKWK